MIFSSERLSTLAEETRFRVEVIEKALHLLNLLNVLNAHPFLKGKWVLKGGTALNLFELDIPRLSVDIDLNYVGNLEREEMLANRPQVEKAIKAVFSREGLTIKRVPNEHAGGKWRLGYQTSSGQSGNLEVDLNFMLRQPLWDFRVAHSFPLGDFQANNIPVLDLHELAAGKLSALLSRNQARDLYDSYKIFRINSLDYTRLRLGFVVYGAMNRKDWRNVSINDIDFDPVELKNQLFPMLRLDDVDFLTAPKEYGTHLVKECRKYLTKVLPLTNAETAFLDLLNGKGEIDATILTDNTDLQRRIQKQPMLQWKALNVKRHKGFS